MSDEKEPEEKATRPNAAYQLSNKMQDEEKPVFYYSREERLAKAPQAVRDLYTRKKPRFSLLRPLINGKGNGLLFGSIILICAALLLVSKFIPSDSREFDGNNVTVLAMKYDGVVIVLIKKTLKKNRRGKPAAEQAYTGAVDIGVTPAQEAQSADNLEESKIFLHRIFWTTAEAEEYRFSVPFEASGLIVVLQTEKKQLSIKVKVE